MGSPRHPRRFTAPGPLASALALCVIMMVAMIYLDFSPMITGAGTIKNINIPASIPEIQDTTPPLPTKTSPSPPPPSPSPPPPPSPDQTSILESQGKIVSKGIVLGTMGATGYMVKQHYRFDNVQLTDNDTLTFYYQPGFEVPPEQHVDTIFNNGSLRTLPTKTMTRDGITHEYLNLTIQYLPAIEHQPNCTHWIEKPTYIMQVQHSENIWHAWNDGIMGAFQTLREQGHLPLVEIDKEYSIKEYTPGLWKGCSWMMEPVTRRSKQLRGGPCLEKFGVVDDVRCDPQLDSWCQQGVVSYMKKNNSGPVLLLFKGSHVAPQWAHMYKAVSDDIRQWNMTIGSCLKEVYLGKSNTLSYYMPLFRRDIHSRMLNFAVDLRANATEAFTQLIQTAENHVVRNKNDPVMQWKGYQDPLFEEFRRGITPENIQKLESIKPSTENAKEIGFMGDSEVQELYRLWGWSRKLIARLLEQGKKDRSLIGGDEQQSALGDETDESPVLTETIDSIDADVMNVMPMRDWSQKRPVVTYMWRDSFKRSVLNAHHMLKYILMRYNVTLRMTTFEEPLPEVIKLMADTDVLIGMHGAGWTNALFLKQKAAALQMLPYGFVLPTGELIRGSSYKEIVLSRNCLYKEWVNPRADLSFIRRHDIFSINTKFGMNVTYSLHPDPEWGLPNDRRPGNHWIYQNTFIDMELMAPVIDEMMRQTGIPIVHNDVPIEMIRDNVGV